MDEETKKIALEKIKSMVSHVAYSDELLDKERLDEYYENLEIHPKSFMKNQLSLNYFQITKNFKRFRMQSDKNENWLDSFSAADVNANYRFFENIFRKVFF